MVNIPFLLIGVASIILLAQNIKDPDGSILAKFKKQFLKKEDTDERR